MAAASHFSTRIYGQIQGNPPYTNNNGQTEFARTIDWNYAGIVSFPTNGTTFFPLPNGIQVGGAYVYSVIVAPPTGLNVHGEQYVTPTSVAALAILAG